MVPIAPTAIGTVLIIGESRSRQGSPCQRSGANSARQGCSAGVLRLRLASHLICVEKSIRNPPLAGALRLVLVPAEKHDGCYRPSQRPELFFDGIHEVKIVAGSGNAWRCWIGPDTLFYRDHGAYLRAAWDLDETQSTSPTAPYTTGAKHYFNWQDANQDDARTLADKFLARFTSLTAQGEGWSYAYAGWYQRLLGLAEQGWMPVVLADYSPFLRTKIPLQDLRPAEWRTENDQKPTLPLPPGGKLQKDVPES